MMVTQVPIQSPLQASARRQAEQAVPERRSMEVQTEMSTAGGKEIIARRARRTTAEVAMSKAMAAAKEQSE
jgi:hypothetical protein